MIQYKQKKTYTVQIGIDVNQLVDFIIKVYMKYKPELVTFPTSTNYHYTDTQTLICLQFMDCKPYSLSL